jgi:hypothetical protein
VKIRVVVTKIQMSVHRVKVDVGVRVMKKQKITRQHPPILQKLAMNFPGKGIQNQ